MSKRFNISGIKQVEKNISAVIDKVGQAGRKGVFDSALDLVNRSVRDAPLDTGTLRGSGHARFGNYEIARGQASGGVTNAGATPPKEGPIDAVVGFSEVYAFKQDQDREANHPKGGKAGYLSDNFRENADCYIKHIENEARKSLK